MTKDRLSALKAAQSEDDHEDDVAAAVEGSNFMEEFFEQVGGGRILFARPLRPWTRIGQSCTRRRRSRRPYGSATWVQSNLR
uniref:Uncharacterized protein n=1 Tax=Plectus sambesii TaxID=2011161 RepID=A0A914WFU7_9BILA